MNLSYLGGGIYRYEFGDSYKSVFKKLGIEFFPKEEFSDSKETIPNFTAETISGKTVISWEVGEKERFYGFGTQYFKLNQRGRTRRLKINSDVRTDTGESNACCPFFVSSLGYGVVVDTASVVEVYLASTAKKSSKDKLGEKDNVTSPDFEYTPPSDLAQIVFPSSGATVYVIVGEDKMEVVKKYNRICGGFVPPITHLGFWHRTDRLYGASEVFKEVEEFKKREFPLSVIGLEPGWQTNAYPSSLTWCEKFNKPKTFTEKLQKMGLYVNNWQHFYISEKSPIYKKLEKSSSDFTVWGGIVPDVWDEKTQKILQDFLSEEQVENGVSGFKIDECDGSEHTKFSWVYPDHAVFPTGVSGEEYRQTVGLILQNMTKEIFAKKNQRTLGLVRASGIGASKMPYAVYTDLYDHQEFVTAMLNASYSGMLFCPEVRGVESGEELVCRFKTALFSPLMMLNAWCDKILPWSYEEVEQTVKNLVNFRCQLTPYIYTQYHKTYRSGEPIIKPMNLLKGFDTDEIGKRYKEFVKFKKVHIWDVFDDELSEQYLFGDRILVVVTKVGERQKAVYLPKGKWVDFNSGKIYDGDQFINYQISIEKLPIFIKGDSVLPLLKGGKIVACVYGNGENPAELYLDDGKTLNFEKGEYAVYKLYIKNGKEIIEKTGNYPDKEMEIVWEKR